MKFALCITHFEDELSTVHERFEAENEEAALKYAFDVFEAFVPEQGRDIEDYDFELFCLELDERWLLNPCVYSSRQEEEIDG